MIDDSQSVKAEAVHRRESEPEALESFVSHILKRDTERESLYNDHHNVYERSAEPQPLYDSGLYERDAEAGSIVYYN